jgi:hypothetical protein
MKKAKALLASHRLYESFGFTIAAPWHAAAESYAYLYARYLGSASPYASNQVINNK